jgi:hypothetical protein
MLGILASVYLLLSCLAFEKVFGVGFYSSPSLLLLTIKEGLQLV